MPVFGLRLKTLRKDKGIMSKTMAETLKINPRTYRRYESGEIDPPTSTTVFLADFFGVSMDYLVGRTDIPFINR